MDSAGRSTSTAWILLVAGLVLLAVLVTPAIRREWAADDPKPPRSVPDLVEPAVIAGVAG